MKITKHTINILKNFVNINKSIYFNEEGYIKTKSENNNIIGIAKIDEIFPEFGIFSLDKFVQILSGFDESKDIEYEVESDVIKISQGKSSVKYRLPEKTFIESSICDISDKYLEFNEYNASFTLDKSDLLQIIKNGKIIGVGDKDDYISIKMNDGIGSIELYNKNYPLNDSFQINIEGKGGCDVSVQLDQLFMIPNNYDIFIADGAMINFRTTDLNYFIGVSL